MLFKLLILLSIATLAGPPIKPPVQKEGFKKFAMDNKLFTCLAPEKWEIARNKEKESKEKIYGIELAGPRADKAPVVIYVTFYSKQNKIFKDHNDFIERNSKDLFGGKGDGDERYGPVKNTLVNKLKAFHFESETKEYLHPESASEESVVVKEKFYVIPVKNGFYVLHYFAPKSVFLKHLPVFYKVASSFKTR
ncbi:MAG: hypothetical protein HY746_03945 [Elusimicrobia bacterium]|nr:hypothetical protein [Elusimicrobiota bacterium]